MDCSQPPGHQNLVVFCLLQKSEQGMRKVLCGIVSGLMAGVPSVGWAYDCTYCVNLVDCLLGDCAHLDLSNMNNQVTCLNIMQSSGTFEICRSQASSAAGDKVSTQILNNLGNKSNVMNNLIGPNLGKDGQYICQRVASANYCCTDCPSGCSGETGWVAASTGYQKNTKKTCGCGSCVEKTTYRCGAGYWGSSTNGTVGCTRCPSPGTSSAGTTLQTGCYVSSGSDGSGAFTHTSNCYYK